MFVNDYTKNAFSKAFYDKTFSVYKTIKSVGVEGDVQTSLSNYSEYYGNVQFNTNERVQKEFGIKENIDLVISTSTSTDVSINDYIEYQSKYYIVKHVLTFDSHINILCEKTELRYTIASV